MNFVTQGVVTPHPEVRTEVLRTVDCRHIVPEITARENEYFGADFEWTTQSTEHWLTSGSMFYAAICRIGPNAHRRIAALASLLVTGTASCEQLLRGKIHEQELAPWFLEPAESSPLLYFSSVLSESPQYLPSLYANLLLDVEAYLQAHQLKACGGVSIAAGPAGYQHLSKNGFVPTNGAYYLHKYRFMRIDASSAKTEFWLRLLSVPPPLDSLEDRDLGRPVAEGLGSRQLCAANAAVA